LVAPVDAEERQPALANARAAVARHAWTKGCRASVLTNRCGRVPGFQPVKGFAHKSACREVTDASGAPISNVLVIIRSIEGEGEKLRALSDASGLAPVTQLGKGKFQVIATQPYGLWETGVKEFVMDGNPATLTLSLRVRPTQGLGDVEFVGPGLDLSVVDRSGHVVPNAEVFVRDHEATFGKWYVTDKQGNTNISLFGNETEIIAFSNGQLATKTIKLSGLDQESRKSKSKSTRKTDFVLQFN